MEMEEQVKLSVSDISTLWTAYQSDTLAVCGIKHFLQHVEDEEIQAILQETLQLLKKNVDDLTGYFLKEGHALPGGFTDQDVHLGAPRLFSDRLYLEYIFNMTVASLATYSAALAVVERRYVVDYFSSALASTKKLHLKAKELSIEKGVYVRMPQIPRQKQVDYVKKQKFLAGWFTDRRPMIGTEITNLVFNARRNAVGHAVITGFSQVAKTKEVRQYFERGRDIARKHLDIFSDILKEDNLPDGSRLMTSEVTESNIAPFSDKMMLGMITTLIATGMGQYGASMSLSPRRDLGAHYARLSAEIATYADDGANIMIAHGWMEQPPIAADRKRLAK